MLAREANVVTTDTAFARSLRDRLDALMRTAGNKLDSARFAGRPWHQRVLDRMAFGVMRAVLFLTGHRY